ncbi:MAG: PDZ domain-containing protein, partial [Hyphomicrobium sp.]
VSAVTPGSPAAKGGLETGDVIMKFDGKDVTTMRGLPKIVAQTPIGKAVDVEVLRKGAKANVQVTIGLLEDEEGPGVEKKSEDQKPQGESPVSTSIIGLKLSPLTDEARRKYNIDSKVTGALVDDVDPASPAAGKGLKPGDVIVEAGQDVVGGPEDVAKSIDKVKKSGRKAVLLRVEDGKGDLRFVAIPFEAEPKQP